MHDLIIKGGTVVDGAGGEAFTADVAVNGDIVTDIGNLKAAAERVIDADGALVTPGFVDIHTHYDGQATWDAELAPSSWHGVTSVVMGNCGVGFAPAAPDRHDWLIGLMEGVEDIPGAALADGITWGWESFAEYLDVLEGKPHAIDVGAQIAHGAVRAYVMGERGAANEAATAEDIQQMHNIVRDGLLAGALGVSTSRTLLHMAVDGEPVPGTFAAEDELVGLASAVSAAGHGLFEVAPAGVGGEDLLAPAKEMAWMREVSRKTGCPISFILAQPNADPHSWKEMLAMCREGDVNGAKLHPQVFGRPVTILYTFQNLNPFSRYPSFEPYAAMPHEQRMNELRKDEVRAKILADHDPTDDAWTVLLADPWPRTFVLGDPPNYEPGPERSVAGIAAARGQTPEEVAYDLLLENDGKAFLFFAVNGYAYGDSEPLREMLSFDRTVIGAADGGAHVGFICDASVPTTMLTHWCRDRTRGERLPLEFVVKKQTLDAAKLFGLEDRGLIEPGYRANLNVIDFDNLNVKPPQMVNDLPTGASRLLQEATGYVATLVGGETTRENGQYTGAVPGRLMRGGK
ncbi:MAG: amidohydrolase family protein [Pseudomonadota bacterium]